MSATLTNNANAGTNGATVTYDNSGGVSGDAWTYITSTTGMSITYTNKPSRGGMSYKFATTSTAAQGFIEWDNFADALPNAYLRMNVFIPAYPSASFNLCELADTTSITLRLALLTTGRLQLRDGANTSMYTSATILPLGQWVRIELYCMASATIGQATLRVYFDVDSPYPVEQKATAATFNTLPNGINPVKVRFGVDGVSVPNFTVYLDGLAASDSGYLGPANASYAAPLVRHSTAEFGSNAVVLNTTNSGNTTNRYLDTINSPGSITFSNAQSSHGTLSYLFQPTAGNESALFWSSLACQSAALRCYIYMTALPTESTEIVQFTTGITGTFAFIGRIGIDTNGHIYAKDSTTSNLWNGTSVLSINTWYRLELYSAIGGSSTTGTLQVAVYNFDSTTTYDSYSTTSANTGAATSINRAKFGKSSATNITSPFYMDSFAIQQQASGFIGPYTAPPAAPAVFTGTIPHIGWGQTI